MLSRRDTVEQVTPRTGNGGKRLPPNPSPKGSRCVKANLRKREFKGTKKKMLVVRRRPGTG